MNNDLISRSELKNLLLDSKPDDLQQSDINFLTGDIKVSLKFVLNIIDNAPTITDRSVEIAQKSMELGRRVGRAEAELYREETCRSKDSCDDYKSWHCVGCNGCKKGGAE